MENYVKIPHCICGKYDCGARDKVVKMVKEEKAHEVLMGLNDNSYLIIPSQVLALDRLPPLDIIFQYDSIRGES